MANAIDMYRKRKHMRLAVNGAAGAMGRRIIALASEASDIWIVAAADRKDHPDLGKDVGTLSGIGALDVALSSDLSGESDVVVDFSAPAATVKTARICADLGAGLVVGTTGLSEEDVRYLGKDVADSIPVLLAPNMSLGVNIVLDIACRMARALPASYDIEIVEMHHRRKKDAPSGTAREIARRLRGVLSRDESSVCYGREGMVGARPEGEIGVHAVRGGDVVGEHTVIFAGDGERIEVTHSAGSRDVFAHGAIQAARFIYGKPAGLYTMSDVLES